MVRPIVRTLFFAVAILVTSCASHRTPYAESVKDPEPGDLPPSSRYDAVRLALLEELPRHGHAKEFYLCQSPAQVAALQKDLPQYRLIHASQTYTKPVEGISGVSWTHRYSDDQPATRVIADIISDTPTKLVIKVYVGIQYPNMEEAVYTVSRLSGTWRVVSVDRPPRIMI